MEAPRRNKHEGTSRSHLKSDEDKAVKNVLRELNAALPKIERRVMDREMRAAESRFEPPRTVDSTVRKNDG